MRITMIGTSGSGKTVFSAAVYSVLMRQEFQGFSIFPQGNLPKSLLEVHRFAKDYKLLARYKWPIGTEGMYHFNFDLNYEGEKITKLEWIDYKGGFLDSPHIDTEQAAELYANIAASNAVILFADGKKLSMAENPNQAAFESGADTVIHIMQGFARNYPESNLTFLIALSKCDAVESHWKGADFSYQPLIEHGLKAFHPLKRTFQREKSWRGGIIPISSVGEGVVEDNKIVNFITPLHIEHVMAYCISSTLRFQYSGILHDILIQSEKEEEIRERYKGFLGILRKTYSYFDSRNNDQDTLSRLRSDIRRDLTQLSKIQVPLEKLADIAMKKVRIIT